MGKALNIMVDIETTSTENNAVILTIGASVFDLDTGECTSGFYTKLRRTDGEALGLHTAQDTLAWWQRQSEAARKEAFDEDERTRGYKQGMQDFADWIIRERDLSKLTKVNLWANDPDFDCVKLKASFDACGILAPWQYWEHKSCRTMELIGEKFGIVRKRDFKRIGTHHNALDDAIYQAQVVSAIWSRVA